MNLSRRRESSIHGVRRQKMRLLAILICVSFWTLLDGSIYLYNSEDSAAVEMYDCLYYQSTLYCLRPFEPVALERDNDPNQCYANGTNHSFQSIRSTNISVHTVLHQWRSTLDKAEEYAKYLRQPMDSNDTEKSLCECLDPQSFGKNCEYRLPVGSSFTDLVMEKFSEKSSKLMYVGDIVCYTTLTCDSGLLCLDWRDICDGIQQCMYGYDEENCDKLEFNECDDDEYRCMNGMCIPDEYFLDGEYDCMDLSDERGPFEDVNCPFQPASSQCDDRLCLPKQWSCGDGQCIAERSPFWTSVNEGIACQNRRDQFFWCETAYGDKVWTLPNGRCTEDKPAVKDRLTNHCIHLTLCVIEESSGKDYSDPEMAAACLESFRDACASHGTIPYPNGAILSSYILQYYNVTYDPFTLAWFTEVNGTIKCRTGLVNFAHRLPNPLPFEVNPYIEYELCERMPTDSNFSNQGYHRFCHNDSKTFSNSSYHWIDVCRLSKRCISAYRIVDGFDDCDRVDDEGRASQLVEQSCSNRIRRHRFRCSVEQPTCYYVTALDSLARHCSSTNDTFAKVVQATIPTIKCNSRSKSDCHILRRSIEASWTSHLHNRTDLQEFYVKKVPFRSYCDTFHDLGSTEDENSTACQLSWTCLSGQWQCHTGQCIDFA